MASYSPSLGVFNRVKDVDEVTAFLVPVTGWQEVPLTNFRDACKCILIFVLCCLSLQCFVSYSFAGFKLSYINTCVDCALGAGESFVSENPFFLPNLPIDIRYAIPAAINLYTMARCSQSFNFG